MPLVQALWGAGGVGDDKGSKGTAAARGLKAPPLRAQQLVTCRGQIANFDCGPLHPGWTRPAMCIKVSESLKRSESRHRLQGWCHRWHPRSSSADMTIWTDNAPDSAADNAADRGLAVPTLPIPGQAAGLCPIVQIINPMEGSALLTVYASCQIASFVACWETSSRLATQGARVHCSPPPSQFGGAVLKIPGTDRELESFVAATGCTALWSGAQGAKSVGWVPGFSRPGLAVPSQ